MYPFRACTVALSGLVCTFLSSPRSLVSAPSQFTSFSSLNFVLLKQLRSTCSITHGLSFIQWLRSCCFPKTVHRINLNLKTLSICLYSGLQTHLASTANWPTLTSVGFFSRPHSPTTFYTPQHCCWPQEAPLKDMMREKKSKICLRQWGQNNDSYKTESTDLFLDPILLNHLIPHSHVNCASVHSVKWACNP